jgi:prepilin-type N-terminal cleavage/methylation domain-containing protein
MRNQNQTYKKSQQGFTLIEIMVVVAIIALLSSIAMIAAVNGQAKSRDARRLGDMTQMNTGLGLYFSSYYGYPSSTTGLPGGIVPTYAANLPSAPMPPDGACGQTSYPAPVPNNVTPGSYYYYPTGTAFLGADGITTVYSDYNYYFCLGAQTGNFAPGIHILTPTGVH